MRAFTITLPGLSGSASFPTYRMTAYNAAGNGFQMVGGERWIPSQAVPAHLTIKAGGMLRILLSVDNRFGNTAWATYNCLPIAEIELER